jgi:hypothetical protein
MPPVLLPAALSWALVLGVAFLLAGGGAAAARRRGLRRLAGEATATLAWPLLVAALADAFFVQEVLRGYPYTASDFEQYCASVAAALRGDAGGWSHQRSWFAGRPAVWLGAGADAFTGLARSAQAGLAAVLVLVALHARALASRRAAVLAAAGCAAASPVLILSRTVTFTPWLVVAALLPGAGAALALRGRGPGGALAAGTAAGLALLLDARASLFVLPALALAAVAALRGPARRSGAAGPARRLFGAALRLALLAAPLAGSYALAARFGDAQAMPLEAQLAFHTRDLWLSVGAPPPPFFDAAPHGATGFVWGHRPPGLFFDRTLPWALRLFTDPALRPPGYTPPPGAFAVYVAPWLPAATAGAALLLWSWRRRPAQGLLLLATLAGPLAALTAALGSLPHPRHLASGTAALAILAAVGLAVLTSRGPRAALPGHAPLPLRPRIGALPAGAVTALLVLGLALLAGPARHTALRWAAPIDASAQPRDVADPSRRTGWARDCLGDVALPARPTGGTRGPPPPGLPR